MPAQGKLVVLVVTFVLTLAGSARASISVTRADDPAGPGNCPSDCSLRQAIDYAADGDTIALGQSSYAITQGTPLIVKRSLTLSGQGTTVIDGGDNLNAQQQPVRIMRIDTGTVHINDLSFTNGWDGADEAFTGCSPCSTINAFGGGAIFNQSTLVLSHVDFSANGGNTPVGGAISNTGTLTMSDVDFDANGAAFGGGLFNRGTVDAQRVSFHDSSGGSYGGAIFIYTGPVKLTNVTVYRNGASNSVGGGIVNYAGNLTLLNVTFAQNVRGGLQTDYGTTSAQDTVIGTGYRYGNDGACSVRGQDRSGYNSRTANPITNDLGNNYAEDETCNFTAASSKANAGDLKLAPLADNGGSTPTVALLHGSPALDGGANCALTDQRGVARTDSACDAGAFEALRSGAPSATSPSVIEPTANGATLRATVNLAGEAGELHFVYGTAPDALNQRTPGRGLGVVSQPSSFSEDVPGLQPGVTYYFRAMATNATGAATSDAEQFTTQAGAPTVSDPRIDQITDTSLDLGFGLDPHGADTTYTIFSDDGSGTKQAASGQVLAKDGAQQVTRTISGLDPAQKYSFRVQATNRVDTLSASLGSASTAQQITGDAGKEIGFTDHLNGYSCPSSATIDWGDGTPASESANIACQGGFAESLNVTMTTSHAYPTHGHFHISVSYDNFQHSDAYAQIARVPGQRTLTVVFPDGSGDGHVTGQGIDCPGVCARDYPAGTQVTLTEEPIGNSGFAGWSGGGCSGRAATCTVTLDADTQLTAAFAFAPDLSDLVPHGWDDTSMTFEFGINPHGYDTHFVISYDDGKTHVDLPAEDAGASQDETRYTRTVRGLKPHTTYTIDVRVSSVGGSTTSDAPLEFTTHQQITQTAGSQLTYTTSEHYPYCPSALSVDWGDGTAADTPTAKCTPGPDGGFDSTISATHTYAKAGRFHIVTTSQNEPFDEAFAVIAERQPPVTTPTPTPTPTPVALQQTPTPTATPTPVFHQDVIVKPVSGVVKVKLKGTRQFVPLPADGEIPLGSEIDVTKGKITLTSVPAAGGPPETATFYAGVFTIAQIGGITNLTLSQPLSCPGKGTASAAAKKVIKRRLWGSGKGAFRTTGRYSAATIRGTTWLVEDTCTSTLTRVKQGVVSVRDRVTHKTKLVRAPHSYTARAKKR